MFSQSKVKVTTAKVGISCGGQHLQLTLVKSAGRDLQRRMAAVNKYHVARLLLGSRQILFVDSIGQCRGSCLIEQPQNIQPYQILIGECAVRYNRETYLQ